MSRTTVKWSIFSAALILVLTVMVFGTVKMVQFENAVATAEVRAATEEKIRLALWRMDSTAAILIAERAKKPIGNSDNFQNAMRTNEAQQALNSSQLQARSSAQVQHELSLQEYQQRAALAPGPSQNWHSFEPVLLERVSDILPDARLEPVDPSPAASDDTRRLASIPARLVVPAAEFAPPVLPWNTPLRVSLMVAWVCALIAAAAVAMLLGGALALSERRGAFVSAVTHELRTPLTTFRMYAEMLAGGMVADPRARQQYLDTLVSESDRLGHLIENVLAYARLERQLSPSRAQTTTVADLLDRTMPALRRRVEQAGLALHVSVSDEAAALHCRTDTIAVQQILLNLVDNACKYGRTDVAFAASTAEGALTFEVADSGPGLSSASAARLFRAFSKSRTDTVPGIGLGLFLSRRLARAIGGDLTHVPTTPGAAFVFRLPVSAG